MDKYIIGKRSDISTLAYSSAIQILKIDEDKKKKTRHLMGVVQHNPYSKITP